MKFIDIFQKIGLTIAALILSLGLFINFINLKPANASAQGRYDMQLQIFYNRIDGVHWYVLVYDTQTGKSKIWRKLLKDKVFKWMPLDSQLPDNPLD